MRSKMLKAFVGLALCCMVIMAVVTRVNRPNQLNSREGNDNLTISFFQKDYKGLLVEIEEQLNESKVIVIARATGKREYVYGNLKQEVKLEKIVRGELPVKIGEKLLFTGNGRVERIEGSKLTIATGFVNYLQKGQSYLLFADECMDDYSGDMKVLKASETVIGLRCLNLSENKSMVCEKTGTQTEYQNVKDSEFFTNDKETLKAMLAIKRRLIKKFAG